MWARILIGGLVGGVLVCCTGAFNHMVLQLQGRTMSNVPEGATFVEHLKTRSIKPGLYWFPDMPTDEEHSDPVKMSEANERYKAGPAELLLIVPPGHDMMTGKTLGLEWASNTVAALLVSWVVSLMGSDVGFFRRWLAIVAIGVVGWFSLTASYGIWYHFPHDFVHDELHCVLLEWGVAGAAIAAIVRRKPVVETSK